MLAEAESGLLDLLRTALSELRLREVLPLPPNLDEDALIKHFVSQVPAVYVAMGDFQVFKGGATLTAAVTCVVRSTLDRKSTHGDGIALGVYGLTDAVMASLDGVGVGSVSWDVTHCLFLNGEALLKNGLCVSLIRLQSGTEVPLPTPINEVGLDDFLRMNSEYKRPGHDPALIDDIELTGGTP